MQRFVPSHRPSIPSPTLPTCNYTTSSRRIRRDFLRSVCSRGNFSSASVESISDGTREFVGTIRQRTWRGNLYVPRRYAFFLDFSTKFRNRINRCAFISNTVAYYLRNSRATNSFSNVGSNNSFRGAIATWPSDTSTRMRCSCRRKIATRNVYRLLVAIRVSYLLIGGT